MKNLLLVLLIAVTNSLFAQQKLKYNKQVYPLIKSGKYDQALPLLETYLAQDPNHTNGHYWAAKIYEIKLTEKDSLPWIKAATLHWQEAKRTVSVGEMLSAKASKYPDISGNETNARLLQFNQMAEAKLTALRAREQALGQKLQTMAAEKQKEEERKASELAEKERISAEKKVEDERKKLEDEQKKKEQEALQIKLQAEKLKAEEDAKKAAIEKKLSDENVKLKNFKGLKINEFISASKLLGLENLMPNGIYYTDAAGQLLELTFSGYYFYNVVNEKEIIQGKFNLIADAKGKLSTNPGAINNTIALISGDLKEGTGSLAIHYEEQNVLDVISGLKLQATYSLGNCIQIRGEQDPSALTHRFFESTTSANLNSGSKFLGAANWISLTKETQAQVTLSRVQLTNSILNSKSVANFNGLKLEKGKTVLNKDLIYVLIYGSDITDAQKAKLVNAKRYKLVLEPYQVKYQLYPEVKGYKLISSVLVK